MLRKIPPFTLTLLSLLLLTLTSIIPYTNALTPSNSSTSSTSTSTYSPAAPSATPSKPALNIGDSSGSIYTYAGCWNESAGLPGTTGLRALDGINEVLEGEMTVEACLAFCARGDATARNNHEAPYRLAGLEYSRECWCGDALNPLTVHLDDDACDLPCDGANTTACGGVLKLSLYNATAASLTNKKSGAAEWRREGAWGGVLAATTVLVLGFSLGGL
ncbi:WSC domain-containing protein [Xylaria castorea]|nr:WSC domain-containing protein [Xylaria castorea]